jgi:hypothetical protein
MSEQNFDNKMEEWAAGEAKAAPELRPTVEMYRLVESKGSRLEKSRTQPHWTVAVGLSLATLVLLIIGGLILKEPAAWFGPTPVQRVAFVEQRKGPDAHTETPEKGKGRGNQSFLQLTLQVHRGSGGTVETHDLQNPSNKPISLTTTDDFRLLIQPAQPRNLYIYLVSPNDDYLALQPETGFNPLHPVETTLLPTPPNWFYLSGESGTYHLLLISATRAISKLDELYKQSIQGSAGPNFESTHRAFREYLESILTDNTKTFEVWELTLNLQD